MSRSPRFVFALALVACGPAVREPKTNRHAALVAEKDPSSSEWLYVTRGAQGSRDKECRTVLETLRGETKCHRDFCQPALHLAKDWTAVCATRFAASAPEVRALEEKFQSALRPATRPCETDFEDLVSGACARSGGEDCRGRAQRWATQCGREYGTPLVITMLSVRAERATGEPVVLDTRSCDEFLAELAAGLSCSNLPDCEERLPVLADYRSRCSPTDNRFPLAPALVMMAVQAAAQVAAEPIQLSELALKPGIVLPFADGQGGVLRVGWSHPSSFEGYGKAVRAADGTEIQVARVFRSADGKPVLRLGKLTAPEGHTLGDRFASFRVQGELEGLQSTALALLQQKLSHASQAQSPRDAAARLLEGLGAFAVLAGLPEPARAALRASDAALQGTCRWLAEEKNRLLSQLGDRRMLVSATRRSERSLFADVAEGGNVVFGSAGPAALYDVRADMPACAGGYDDALTYLVRRVRTIKLPKADEDAITADADTKRTRCAAAAAQLTQTEEKVLDCAFALRQCSEEELDTLAQDYDRTAEAVRRARWEARLAVASVREDLREDRAGKLARECPDGNPRR